MGVKVINDLDLQELVDFIDWKPFFDVWQLRGKYPNRNYPNIFKDEQVGPEAKKIFDDAKLWLDKLLKESIEGSSEHRLVGNAVIAFFPAASDGDDVQLYDPDTLAPTKKLHGLRQQSDKEHDQPCLCISDFIKPLCADGKPGDYVGMFACTVLGAEEIANHYEKNLMDDYGSIMVKALADR